MTLLETIIRYFTNSFFSLSLLCTLVFFYKAIRHHHKSYGLLMVSILVATLFACSVIELLVNLEHPDNEIFDILNDTLTKFAYLWIICLALCHYFIIRSFKGRYENINYKIFIICGSIISLAIACITNIK